MHMTSSVVVKSDLERAWAFLSNERNAPRWDRSVARADLISPPHVLRFSLLRSAWFRTAQLSFTLTSDDHGVRITHDIDIALRFRWAILGLVFALFNKRALGADLDSLRRAIDESHDLTAVDRPR